MSDERIVTIHMGAFAEGWKAYRKAAQLREKPIDYPFMMALGAYLRACPTSASTANKGEGDD
jgi:hypothetical protein